MKCDDVRGRLPLFLTADLPPAEADAVRAHLAGCPACRADRAELEQVRGLLDAAPVPAVGPVDVATVYRAALDQQVHAARRWKRIAAGGALVAAGLLLVAVLPKLEVKVGGKELVVRWGPADPPPVPTPPPSPPQEPIDYVLLARVT
jgi:anti-sigma factor RsiW